MKAAFSLLIKTPGLFVWQTLGQYRRDTGQGLLVWVLLALLNGGVQIIFRRQLAPGEFATFNTLLGAIGVILVPIVALRQAFATFSSPQLTAERFKIIRDGRVSVVQNFALVWVFLGGVFFVLEFNGLYLPRKSPLLVALPTFALLLGAALSATIFEQANQPRRWILLLLAAGLVRLVAAWFLTASAPWSEAALGAGFCAGAVLVIPLLRQTTVAFGWSKMTAVLRDGEFRRHLFATLSVTLGIFLFINADRIVAQGWFGRSTDNNLGLVRWSLFDGYQAAGLLGRGILWGTQPLLAVLFARRLRQDRTDRKIVILVGIYLAVVLLGAVLLYLFKLALARLFGGVDIASTAYFIPGFATAILPLALLQGVGIFVLASRRHPECWMFGLGAIAYTIFLLREGKPQIMLASMFSGGGVALLAMLLLLVVRWGRKQP